MTTLEERVASLEADLPTRMGYVRALEGLQQGQQLLYQRMDALENDVSEVKSDVKLLLQHFKIDT